ncbi:MAG: hypothetical protein Q7K28_01235, partial [Candidatus Wildermuthbacteria bacterium]|nr:hypothetical protein [Candidatus Wildermuthbacteria bacterium]
GSLISDKKIELLRQYKTRVGVSIDGYWPANRWRGKTKKNTDLVVINILKLKKAGIQTGILITLHKDNASPQKIKYIEKLILDMAKEGVYSKINLICHADPKIELTVPEAKRACLRLAGFFLHYNLSHLKPFRNIIDNLLGYSGIECTFKNCDPYCTQAIHITSQGVPNLCGRFMTEVFHRPSSPTSARWEILRQTDCRGCRYGGKVCFGGCPAVAKDWDWRNKDRFCEVYKSLYEFFEKKLKLLAPSLLLKTDPGFKPHNQPIVQYSEQRRGLSSRCSS